VTIDLDEQTNQAIVTIHWQGGHHTELLVSRVRRGWYPADRRTGIRYDDRCAANPPTARHGPPSASMPSRLAPFDPPADRVGTITADEWASRLGICVGSVQKLIREGVPRDPAAALGTVAGPAGGSRQ
jgi:hypothetical protein